MKDLKFINSLILIFLSLGFFNSCKSKTEIKPIHKDIIDAVFASGHIENENQYTINANVDGFLNKIYISEGDTVYPETPLFYLTNDVQNSQVISAHNNLDYALTNASPYSPQINQLGLEINQAREKKKLDSLNYSRYAHLIQSQSVSKVDFDNAKLQYISSSSNLGVLENNLKDLLHTLNLNVKNAKAQLDIQKETNDYYHIKSKANGIILSLPKKIGDYVKKGDILGQIGSGKPLIKLYIAEDDINRVKLGQKVIISLNSNNDTTYEGIVRKIYPSFDQNDQSFIVDADFTITPKNLINGTQLQANIIVNKKPNALVIPSNYIQSGDYVFIKGNKEKSPIKIGIRTLEYSEVLSGLNDTEIIYIPKP